MILGSGSASFEILRYLVDRLPVMLTPPWVHTPVQPTPEAEEAALAASYADPRKFDHDKLFPGTEWEILKPARSDYIGFFGTWALVGVIVLMLWTMVNLR